MQLGHQLLGAVAGGLRTGAGEQHTESVAGAIAAHPELGMRLREPLDALDDAGVRVAPFPRAGQAEGIRIRFGGRVGTAAAEQAREQSALPAGGRA